MEQPFIPTGNQAVMPYLMLGSAAAFIDFTKAVFGATLNGPLHKRPDDDTHIMHAEVTINGCTMMCCDARDNWKITPGSFFIYVGDVDETYSKALELGAKSIMGISNQEYGRTCGITDPQGNTWWITTVLKH